jgi:hypothetical protein
MTNLLSYHSYLKPRDQVNLTDYSWGDTDQTAFYPGDSQPADSGSWQYGSLWINAQKGGPRGTYRGW